MIFCTKTNIKVFHKLIVFFLPVIASHAQSNQNGKFNIFTISLKKRRKRWSWFLHAYKHQFFWKLILLILVGVARHAQNTQNNKFVKSIWYPRVFHFGTKFRIDCPNQDSISDSVSCNIKLLYQSKAVLGIYVLF